MNHTKLLAILLSVFILFPVSAQAASGDILKNLNDNKNVSGAANINENLNTNKNTDKQPSALEQKDGQQILSFELDDDKGTADALREKIASAAVTVATDSDKWQFTLLKDQLRLEQRSFVRFNGLLLPVENTVKTQDLRMVQKYHVSVAKNAFIPFIRENIEKKINRPKQDVRIKKEDDRIIFDGTATDGQKVDREALINTIGMAVSQNVSTISAPVISQPGQVFKEKGLEDLNIKELVSVGISDFGGSPQNRIHNINTGLKRFNGIVIKQGEEFSFNKQLGPVDGTTGFLPELVIKGPKTIPEYGGGLCQISSTMFRAALFRGLPILERRNHSYAVQYYVWPLGWGFDATIYPGSVDMKFKNDSPGDILVQAYTEGTHVYYKFYGIKDDRTVDVSGPTIVGYRGAPASVTIATSSLPAGVKKLTEKAHTGLTAYFTRKVDYPDGQKIDEKFTSVYQARPAVYMVGAGQSAPDTSNISPDFFTGDIGE